MAKAVPVKVRLSEDAVNPACLQKSLEILHMCVIMEVIRGEKYSDRQRKELLTTMQQKIVQYEYSGCFRDDVPEKTGGDSYV